MANIISDPIWKTIQEKVKEGNLTELLGVYTVNNLDYNAKDGNRKSTVLHETAEQDKQEIAGYLIKHGADVNTKNKYGSTPLHVAARNNSVELAKVLLEHGADVDTKNSNGSTPLHVAVMNNSGELAKLLLQHGADVNTKDKYGETLLHDAASKNSVEVAKLLLAHGADVNTKSSNGYTPLYLAASNNSVEVAKLLLEHGADVNTKSSNGSTPLHVAASNNSVEVVKLLLKHGAEVNSKDSIGDTPLHVAASNNSVELAKLLLEHGADVNTKSSIGDTPLNVAASNNSVEVAKLLLQHRADISTTDKDNESGLHNMQKKWSKNDLQDTFRAFANSFKYSNPAIIVQELDIREEFDDDVKSILSNILKEAIDKLPGIMDDPEHRFTFYGGDLYIPLVKEFLKRPSGSGETILLHNVYIALQAKTLCNQSKREMLESRLSSDIYKQFRRKIKKLATTNNIFEKRETKELTVIAQQIYAEYMKDEKVKEYCCKAVGKTQECCNVNCSFCLPNPSGVYHSCSAIGMMGRFLCLLGIVVYILDLYTDLVVGISDFNGFSKKLGIFEIALVSFTLIHENYRSADSTYTTEEEVLQIKFGRFWLSGKEMDESNLNSSINPFVMLLYKISCPFKLKGSFLSKLKATIYNLLTCLQLRPVVDRLVVFLHEPISLREYYRRQAEQNSLKQFYLILEQLPELLVQFYTFQMVINNLSQRDIEQFAGECYHYFDYQRMNTNITNDTNLFCENLPLSDTGLGTCGTVFRIFSMAIPFFNIPSGIASLEDAFRKLDPLTPKMSTILKIIFQTSYTLMIPARLFMFAAVMHAVFIKEYVFGYIIFRVIIELLVNLYSHKANLTGLSLKSVSILWRMVLFSIRDVFLISIRNPDAYLSKPSEVSYKSLRKRKNLAVRAIPFICEGLVAALIIEQRYPCGKHFNYFKYLGWFCIIPLVLSVSAIVMVSDLFHPFKGRSSSLGKETQKLLLAVVISIMGTFIVSQKRGSVELLVMGLVIFLHIVLVAGLCLFVKMSNKSKESKESKETPYTPLATSTASLDHPQSTTPV